MLSIYLQISTISGKFPKSVASEMVFFVCEACNETLKRNQVEKHRCHSGYTCVDCSRTFYGDEFKAHITCVTEAEKYEGSLFKKKESKKSPQETWMEAVTTAVENSAEAPENIRLYLSKISSLGNVPRNKNKFSNFLKNSFKIHSDSVINGIWDFLERTAKKSLQESKVDNCSTEVPAVTVIEEVTLTDLRKSKKKRDRAAEGSPEDGVGVVEAVLEASESKKSKKKRDRAS